MPLDPLNDPLLRAPRSHAPTIAGMTEAANTATPEQLADFVDAIGASGDGSGGHPPTDLGATTTPTGVTVTSSTGADALLPLATATNAGLMAPAQHAKLADLPTAAALAADQAAQDQAISGKADASHTHTAAAIGAATAAQGAKADTALQPGVLPVGTTLPAAQISDATAPGRTLLTAADAAAQRTALALGNVSNTADADKPVSTAQALAIAAATTADAIADTLEAAPAADLARIQYSVSGAGIEFAGGRARLPIRSLLRASAAGVQPSGPLLIVGDSTSWGLYTAGGPRGSWPRILADMLTGAGMPASHVGYGAQSLPAGGVVDARVTPGAGWLKSIYGFGSVCDQSSAATTPLTYAVTGFADTIKVYFLRNSGLGTCAVAVNGAGAGSVPTAGAAGVGTQTITFARTQNPSITLTPSSNVFIYYAEIYDSTAKSLRICNAGVAGSMSSGWSGADSFGALAAITAMAPAHTVIMLGRNDAAQGRTAAQYLADITAIAARAAQTGGVTLMSAIGGNVPASETLLAQYLTQLRTLTQYPLIVSDGILGGYADANAAGLMFDAIHENGPGHAAIAGGVFDALLSL